MSLAQQIAERQQRDAAAVAEPFSAAARTGGVDDPFTLADEQLKVPRELLKPYEASQQVRTPGSTGRCAQCVTSHSLCVCATACHESCRPPPS
jgi:hypothetical protein